ncbi:MAG: hypothetical protein IJS51_07035 [Treponema sp.]|nr:hypothetical protein [Treponema sp.]
MKKITVVLAALAVSSALCLGLFISCGAGEDNSQLVAAYIEAARIQREAAEYTKLISIGVQSSGAGHGTIAERDQEEPRKYADSEKKYAVITFEAIPASGNRFSLVGVKATTEPASTLPYPKIEAHPTKTNYFTVTVPIETTTLNIDKSNAFESLN